MVPATNNRFYTSDTDIPWHLEGGKTSYNLNSITSYLAHIQRMRAVTTEGCQLFRQRHQPPSSSLNHQAGQAGGHTTFVL